MNIQTNNILNSGRGMKISALRKSIERIDQVNLRSKRLEPLDDKSMINIRLGEDSLDRTRIPNELISNPYGTARLKESP